MSRCLPDRRGSKSGRDLNTHPSRTPSSWRLARNRICNCRSSERRRWQQLGYYSGDTHIHLPRRDTTDDARALDLIEAEDLQFGFLLSANNGKSYSGIMDRQTIAPQCALGPDSVARRGAYEIASGQEYVTSSYGHLGMLMHKKMVLEGLTVDVNRWPLLGMIGQETRKLDGYSINLHGGYANEIYIDFAQAATDGVELLQFAEYRGIELAGWYRMLNVGYRFPALGFGLSLLPRFGRLPDVRPLRTRDRALRSGCAAPRRAIAFSPPDH